MKAVHDKYDVGVIVGRFQVPELHEGHIDLISHVCEQHGKVILFLGTSPLKGTQTNPLDFEARRQMIQETFPDINVLYIKDQFHDEVWSKHLDEMIEDVCTPGQTVVLYGSRDSFISHYTGRYPTQELEADRIVSGEVIRRKVSGDRVKQDPAFRAGAVWQAFNRFPTAFTTVDVAVFNEDETKILLARKQHEKQWRLIGGFSNPNNDSFEADARREVQEEAGIAITDPEYIGSFAIDDWRYRSETDGIKTVLFKARLQSGAPRPDDDVAEVGWFNTMELADSDIVPNHRGLIAVALEATSNTHSQR